MLASNRLRNNSFIVVQLKKVKDVPRLLQRLRLTQGMLAIHDFQLLHDRSYTVHPTKCVGLMPRASMVAYV